MLFHQFTGELDAFSRVHHIDGTVVVRGTLAKRGGHVVGDDGASHPSFLRGYHDDTVGGTGTVEGGGCRILQHVDTFDVLRVDAGDGVTDAVDVVGVVQVGCRYVHGVLHHDAVQHPQRLTVTDERRSTADTQFGHHAYLTGIVHHD